VKNADKKGHAFAKRLRKNMPDAEYLLWQDLRKRQVAGHHFRRQLPIGPYVADFACVKEKLVIELDGYGHSELYEIEHDRKRTVYMNNLGWQVIRFYNNDVYDDIGAVIDAIAGHLSTATEAEKIDV